MILALFIYSLACFGLSFTLAYAKITLPLRDLLAHDGWGSRDNPYPLPGGGAFAARFFLSWMECVACTGWWVGLAVGFVVHHYEIVNVALPSAPIVLAFYSLAVNVLLGRFARLID